MLFKNIYRDRASNRGVELGPYPLEVLKRDPSVAPTARLQSSPPTSTQHSSPLAQAANYYADLFIKCAEQSPAPAGEGSTDPALRSREMKGAAYYLDAAQVGICELPEFIWFAEPTRGHTHGIVVLTAFGAPVEKNSLAADWIAGAEHAIAHMRALEIGVSLTGHIRALGFDAQCHHAHQQPLCFDTALLLAGLAQEKRFVCYKSLSSVAVCSRYCDD